MVSKEVVHSREQSRVSPALASGHRNSLYRLGIRPIWRFLSTQPASYWLICTYLFLEYVRPQTLYPSIDFLPWTRIVIILCALAFVYERKVFRIKGQIDILFLVFTFVVLASSVAASKASLALASPCQTACRCAGRISLLIKS